MKRKRIKYRKNRKNNLIYLLFFLFIIGILLILSKSNPNLDSKEKYINDTKLLAIKVAKKYNLFPSVILAQSALESNFGKSELSQEYNNYFGIKSNNKKNQIKMNTKENINGDEKILAENFRVYKSKFESFDDYGDLIFNLDRYKLVRQAKTPQDAAYALYKCGYATDPKYANKIIHIIYQYNLEELDSEIIK